MSGVIKLENLKVNITTNGNMHVNQLWFVSFMISKSSFIEAAGMV